MRSLLDHLGLKAASLGIAAALWLAIAGEKTSEVGFAIPIELQNFPKDMELTGEPVNVVQARLRAPASLVQHLQPGEISARIDLTGVGEGEHIEHLTEDSIRVPLGVQVVKLTPAAITLNIERTLQKTLPIHPRLLGKPAAGYEVAGFSCSPSEVMVAGPSSRVREVDGAFTEPVSVDNAHATLVERVTVGLEDPVLRIHGSPRVRVTVHVQETQEKKTFAGLPVAVRGAAASVAPARVTVVLTGPVSIMGWVTRKHVLPYVEVEAGAPAGSMAVEVQIAPGLAGVSLHQTDPARVMVRPRRGP